MKDFRSDRSFGNKKFGGGKFGGNKRFGGGRGFGDRDADRPMFQATCSACGKDCQVPFRPSGEKPVFCSDCFRSQRDGEGGGRREERHDRPARRDFNDRNDRPMYHATCAKCGNDCEVPFRPTGDKPVYCSNCFDKGGSAPRSSQGGNRGGSDDGNLAALNEKLDKILRILTSNIPAKLDIKDGNKSLLPKQHPIEVLAKKAVAKKEDKKPLAKAAKPKAVKVAAKKPKAKKKK